MTSLKVYQQVTPTVVIEKTVKANTTKIKSVFLRYAKAYKLAYGKYPTDHSLSIELTQYTGVSIDTLKTWIKEIN